jgi:Flp pilus assembly CpaE family ATPase
MRQRLGRPFLEGLLATLRRETRYVVLDTGAELLGTDGAFHRAVLGLADQVLLVTAADLVGLWHSRMALGFIRDQLKIDASRLALVLNRYDARFHHSRVEIEWALGIGTAAVIPFDHAAVQRSIAAQRPLVLDQKSRAAQTLLDLAGRVHGGKLVLPPEPGVPARRGIRGLADRLSGSLRWPSVVGAGRPSLEESDANVN